MTTREPWISLLAAILEGSPAVPQAACRDRSHLFDPREHDEPTAAADYRHSHALELCESCPELPTCRAWFDALAASQRPLGVTAGRLITPTPVGRPKKQEIA